MGLYNPGDNAEFVCVNPNSNCQHLLCDFFRYVEEAKRDIHEFNEAIQVYEAKMQEPLRYGETQVRYEYLQATMSSITLDIRRLRNYAWQLGDKNGHFLLRHANAVLATFQATCSLLHSIEARSRHEQERSTGTGYGARSGNPIVELDNEHLNQPVQPIYDEKTECAESAPHISLDLGGPLHNARIWRQRKLLYISVAAASVVLVMAVGFATGYTAAGIR